jgi:hypothetical protein
MYERRMSSPISPNNALVTSQMFSIPLEFKLVEREVPDVDSGTNSGIRRGKIKEHDIPKWTSTWIPWDVNMEVPVFLRNLQRELAAVGLAATRDVERILRARIGEYLILYGQNLAETTQNIPKSSSSSGGAAAAISRRMAGDDDGMRPRYKTKKRRAGDEDDGEDDDEPWTSRKAAAIPKTSTYKTRSAGLDEMFSPIAVTSRRRSSEQLLLSPLSNNPVERKRSRQFVELAAPPPPPSYPPSYGDDSAQPQNRVLGKGRKFCKGCQAIIASSRRECPHCHIDTVG